MGTSSL